MFEFWSIFISVVFRFRLRWSDNGFAVSPVEIQRDVVEETYVFFLLLEFVYIIHPNREMPNCF